MRDVAVSPDRTPTPVDSTPELRKARLRPLLVEDALFTIPDVAWQMQRVGDMNGDGLDDLVVQRGGVFWVRGRFARWTSVTGWGHPKTPARIDAVSARDGSLIRTLWSSEEMAAINWDAGGDLDGDSIPDLLVGRDGSAVVVSGCSGELLREISEPSDNPYPRSVAFLEDVDGDGRDEFVVGAPAGPDHAGQVTMYAGRDGAGIWSLDSGGSGNGFGLCSSAIGDIDGDSHQDVAIASVPGPGRPLLLVSSASGERIAWLPDNGGPFGPAGDVNGDGRAEVFLGALEEDSSEISGSVRVLSPGNSTPRFQLLIPDCPFGSPYARVVPLGDVDGDGTLDFLLGNPDFNVSEEVGAPDLTTMTLKEAIQISSAPWCAFTWHSGTAWVRSGRTQEVIMAVWGPPGSRQGMGLAGCSVPDLDGDGWPEIAVVDMDGAYVFPGPGVQPE